MSPIVKKCFPGETEKKAKASFSFSLQHSDNALSLLYVFENLVLGGDFFSETRIKGDYSSHC